MLPKDDELSSTITNLKVHKKAIFDIFTCELLKPVQTYSAGDPCVETDSPVNLG